MRRLQGEVVHDRVQVASLCAVDDLELLLDPDRVRGRWAVVQLLLAERLDAAENVGERACVLPG